MTKEDWEGWQVSDSGISVEAYRITSVVFGEVSEYAHLPQREQLGNALSHFCFRSLHEKQLIEATSERRLVSVAPVSMLAKSRRSEKYDGGFGISRRGSETLFYDRTLQARPMLTSSVPRRGGRDRSLSRPLCRSLQNQRVSLDVVGHSSFNRCYVAKFRNAVLYFMLVLADNAVYVLPRNPVESGTDSNMFSTPSYGKLLLLQSRVLS